MNKDALKRITEIGSLLKEVDSKAVEEELKKELKTLDVKQFDGLLVIHDGKHKRIKHAFFAQYYVCGNKTNHYNWSGNKRSTHLDAVEFVEELGFDHDGLDVVDGLIYKIKKELAKLCDERRAIRATCHHKPGEFDETDELVRHTIGESNLDEAFCDICGTRITS
jgi:hypothetical protein